MQEISHITNRLRMLYKNWTFHLSIVTSIAIILRCLPGWTYPAWGNDFGIYYGITNTLVESGELFGQYLGWGQSYQYFPVLYAVTGFVHWITGIDTMILMPRIAPIFGGLSVLIFYFVVKELLYSKKIAIFATMFLAVLPFHVYQTSHASPLTMGHFFIMLSMYLFIKYRQDNRYMTPLLISTLLLVMSHHLSTYFFLVSIIFIVFTENASIKQWTMHIKKDIFYVIATSGMMFSYWIFVATPVFDLFMERGLEIGPLQISSYFLIMLFYLMFFSLFAVINLKRKYDIFSERKKSTPASCIFMFSITLIISLIIMGVFTVIKIPWTNFSFTPIIIIYAIPLLLTISFGIAGLKQTRFIRNGYFIRGWMFGISLSFIFSLVTNSTVLYPHRHIEYLMVPLSIIAVYGLRGILLNSNRGKISRIRTKIPQLNLDFLHDHNHKWFTIRKPIYVVLIIVLIATNAVSIYPPHEEHLASYEVITHENLFIIDWMKENLDAETAVVASDHRLSRMVESAGFNTTRDDATNIFKEWNLTDYANDLYATGSNYSYENKITHVVIDDIMKDKILNIAFAESFYMRNESYDKFQVEPYTLIYRNATIDPITMEETHWAEIYEIDWEYVERYFSDKEMIFD